MDDNSIKEDDNINKYPKKKPKKLLKYFIFIVLAAGIGVAGYYLKEGELPSIEGVFTSYNNLTNENLEIPTVDTNTMILDTDLSTDLDSIAKKANNADSLNSTLVIGDTSSYEQVEKHDKQNSVNENPDRNKSIFKVNTSYEKLANLPLSIEKVNEDNVIESKEQNSDLFTELLLSNSSNKTTIDKIFKNNDVAYKSLLKLISIAGLQIIVGEDMKTSKSIIDVIAESDNISEILIIDRNGNVVYKTSKLKITIATSSEVGSLNSDVEQLHVTELEDGFIITWPIFHTYGKIGIAVIFVK